MADRIVFTKQPTDQYAGRSDIVTLNYEIDPSVHPNTSMFIDRWDYDTQKWVHVISQNVLPQAQINLRYGHYFGKYRVHVNLLKRVGPDSWVDDWYVSDEFNIIYKPYSFPTKIDDLNVIEGQPIDFKLSSESDSLDLYKLVNGVVWNHIKNFPTNFNIEYPPTFDIKISDKATLEDSGTYRLESTLNFQGRVISATSPNFQIIVSP